jgi:aryl-alcohol dehydrogenase-like predicted oxidoreductase
MKYRRLGKSELKVSDLGLGCSRLGSVTQSGGDQAALRLIGCALDAGINFFDTADIYGQGASEILLGKAVKAHRDRVVLASKAGYCLSAMGGLAKRFKPLLRRLLRVKPGFSKSIQKVRAAQVRQDFSTPYLAGHIEASLRRLRIETLDLFYLHSPPADVLKRGEVFEALETFKRQGKLRHYGVSCQEAEDALLCAQQPGVAAIQLEINLLKPDALEEALPASRAGDMGVVARQALAGGLLSRSVAELQPEAYASREQFEAEQSRLAQFEKLAAETGGGLGQMAVQFLRQLDGISSVLIGTTNPGHLQEYLAAPAEPLLSPDCMARIQALLGTQPASL